MKIEDGIARLLEQEIYVMAAVSQSIPAPIRREFNESIVAGIILKLNEGDMDKTFRMIDSLKINLGKLEKNGEIGIGSQFERL
jgi:hypothetical protein